MLRSNFERGSTRWAVRRSQWCAMGMSEEDFAKPKIAVVNSSSTLSVCYIHLDEISQIVQKSIREHGGLPFEIRTAAPSDFVTSAGKKARYILPSRDLIVNDIEVMVEGACLDGMVLLSSCDKTTPAHLMAAARLNVPSIVVPCGYQLGGTCGGREVDIEEVYKAVGTVATGSMSVDDLECWTKVAIQGPGVCAGLATANSMHIMAEAIGMAASGTTPIRGGSEKLKDAARASGESILRLIKDDLRPRKIMNEAGVKNAIRVAIGIGASVNVVRHLAAIATEAELDLDVVGLFESLGKNIPQITQIKPNGPDRIEDLEAAGGTKGVQTQLRDRLELDATTISGKKLGEVLGTPIQINEEVIRPMSRPFRPEPGLVILRGNLAPDGAIMKISAVPGALREFEGPARVFEDEDVALEELKQGGIHPGDVVVLRMMGPIGGPGTVFACSMMAALVGAGLGDKVAVVTDGELSGLNRGITVGQVMPEAAAGGPLAVVREGEQIRIDVPGRRIDLKVSDLDERVRNWKLPDRDLRPGWLAIYSEIVQPIQTGAVLGKRRKSGTPARS
ncbi:MAG TPA: dihydroxy-acid dehydratase [Candidatus Sulfotelmatobacter sp.]|nr:dihydroxy-acid dehydratase [Candidatus Sulfotelmatobacter sp.]